VPEKGVAVEGGRGVLRRAVLYCERSVELLVDLLSQLPTRRFVHAVLDDRGLLVKARRSALYAAEQQGSLFRQLLDLVAFYLEFPIDDHTGEALSEDDVTSRHYEKVRAGVCGCVCECVCCAGVCSKQCKVLGLSQPVLGTQRPQFACWPSLCTADTLFRAGVPDTCADSCPD
jgi:hypothetical protein